ncbi:MAG: hypothetical protein STSR0008_17690 [Ignavibacterium sp.]
MEDVIAVFIPIVIVLVVGIIIIAIIYFESKEKQAIIEKGLSPEQIISLYGKKRKSGNVLLIWGIIILFFGVGLGIGMMFEEWYHQDFYTPLFLFAFTGIGLILAFLFDRKLKPKNENEIQHLTGQNKEFNNQV